MVLNGIQELLENYVIFLYKTKKITLGESQSNIFCRYANDMVFLSRSLLVINSAKILIKEFLKPPGLNINQAKIKVIHNRL